MSGSSNSSTIAARSPRSHSRSTSPEPTRRRPVPPYRGVIPSLSCRGIPLRRNPGQGEATGSRGGSGRLRLSWLSGLEEGALEVVVHSLLGHPEGPADPHRGQLTGVHQPVHRHLGDTHCRGDLCHGQELHLGERLLTTG